MENESLFDLIEVYFSGEVIQARPYEFDRDENGDLICPTKASTSCPFCGHGNIVNLTGWQPGCTVNAQCENCGAGESSFDYPDSYSLNSNIDTVSVERDIGDIEKEILESLNEEEEDAPKINIKTKGSITIDTSSDVQTLKSDCPFVDPIQMGTFVLDEV